MLSHSKNNSDMPQNRAVIEKKNEFGEIIIFLL